MSFGATAAVVGAGATIYGAKKASDSAQDAQNENYLRWLQSRGFGTGRHEGFALLPGYFQDWTGKGFEAQLARDIMDDYTASREDFDSRMDRNRQLAARFRPMFDQGTELLDDLYGGGVLDRRIAAARPVQEANLQFAEATASGIDQGLEEALGRLNATFAKQGFTGGSSFANNAATRATIGARQDAARTRAAARRENAELDFNLVDNDINDRFAMLDLVPTRAQQSIALDALPREMAIDANRRALEPFAFFRMGEGQPPQVTPTPSLGQIVGSGIAAGAGAVGSYFNNRALADAIRSGRGGTTLPSAGYDERAGF